MLCYNFVRRDRRFYYKLLRCAKNCKNFSLQRINIALNNRVFVYERAIPALFYVRGSQPGVHVPLRVHLPIWRGKFKVSNSRVFFKENVRYPVWICRDPISLILGTRFSPILGIRLSLSLKRLKKTLAIEAKNISMYYFFQIFVHISVSIIF